MREQYRNMKIQTKIMLIYVLVLCFSIAVSAVTFNVLNTRYVEEQIGEVSAQTVDALKGNLSIMFESVEQFSNLLYFDKDVQDALDSTESIAIDPTINNTIQKSLVNMLLSANYIESVFIFDRYYNSYSSKKIAPITTDAYAIEDTQWYQRADELDGATLYIYDTEGIITYPTKPEHRGITLVRAINSDKDYSRLALLLININESTITQFFDEIGSEQGAKYCIVDSEGNFVIQPPDASEAMQAILQESGGSEEMEKKGYAICYVGQEKYCVVQRELGTGDWSLVGMVPISKDASGDTFQKTLIILFIALLIFVVAVCSMMLMRLVFRPLSEIEEYMAHVEHAVFLAIPVEEQGTNEIIRLKRGFNSMVAAISSLLEKVKEEEKILARSEFEILQAQINPHFLYNTLDAISALALTKQYDRCFQMTQALGQFYRNSLNSGKQVVTVRDELDCVYNYITILNIRYDNKINLICDVQEEIMDYDILKLVLQPIVENAVYHGIRNRDCEGTICITGYTCENEIILNVSDDGVGMPEEKIEEIMSGNSQKGKSGFGLYSEIQRISLFYDMENPVTITSEIDSGTEVTICLRRL